LSPSDLIPTEVVGTRSAEIYGPGKYAHVPMPLPDITVTEPEPPESAPEGQILQTVTVEHEYFERPPRLHLRNSFRNSFTRPTMLSLGKFKIPN
jgi:hypothetical protein